MSPMRVSVAAFIAVAISVAIVRAQAGQADKPAPSANQTEKPAPGASLADKPSASAGQPAVAAAPGKSTEAAASSPAPAVPAPAGSSPQGQETLEQIVARVQRRLAEHQASARGPRQRPPADKPAPPSPRVKLVWRPSVVWPSEIRPATPASSPAGRVKLSWDVDVR